jgi:hypothetical protein
MSQTPSLRDAPVVTDNTPGDDNDGVDAFLDLMKSPDADDQPSGSEDEKKKRRADDEDDDEPSDESPEDKDADDDEGEEADDDDEDDKKRKYADDDDETYVKLTVNGKEEEVSVKSLKRLYGQEKALTQKSQEVAEHRKSLEQETEKNALAHTAIFKRAEERWAQYAGIDFNLAAKELSTDEYAALKAAAQSAYEDVQFLGTQLDAFHGTIKQRQQADLVDRAKKSLEVLTGDPESGGIDGFNEKLYEDVRAYAIKEGFSRETVANLVDASAIRIMHKAMLYDRGRAKASSKTTIVKKVDKTPKKVIKTSSAPDRTNSDSKSHSAQFAKANAKLRETGSMDDAAEAFMALAGIRSDR